MSEWNSTPYWVDLELARLSLNGGRFDEAAQQFAEIIRRSDAQCPEAWFGLGVARLLGTTDLEAGFSEAIMAFSHCRAHVGSDGTVADTSICQVVIDYYARLGGAIVSLNQAMRNAQTNLICGIGLAAFSVAVGNRGGANYFQQTLGVLGTVSGAGMSAAALQGHGNDAQTRAFILNHMDAVRRQAAAMFQDDEPRLRDLAQGFSAADRVAFPERFPAQASTADSMERRRRGVYRLIDRRVIFGLYAGLAHKTRIPVTLVRITPFVVVGVLFLPGILYGLFAGHRPDDPVDGAYLLAGFASCSGFLAVAGFGLFYLIAGLAAPKLDSKAFLGTKIPNKPTGTGDRVRAVRALEAGNIPPQS